MTSKRNPLLTAKGTRYTYAGWVRVYHAALKSGVPNLAYRLAESYPEHYNKHQEQARKRDLGSRQHTPSPGVPRSTAPKRKAPKAPKKSEAFRWTAYALVEGDAKWHPIQDTKGTKAEAVKMAEEARIARGRYGNLSPVKHIVIRPYNSPPNELHGAKKRRKK